MADKITWNDKVSLVTDPTIAEINKVTDDNMNEIKSVTNANADELTEKIVYDEDDITENTGLIIEEVPEGSNIPYINSEIAIGSTNEDNRPVWFKKGKNLFNQKTFVSGDITNGNPTIRLSSRQNIYLDAGTYTFSTTQTNTFQYILTMQSNGAPPLVSEPTWTYSSSWISDTTKTFTITTPGYFCIYLRKANNTNIALNEISGFNYYLTKGSTATTEDYISPSIIADNTEFYSQDNYERYSLSETRIETWIDGKPIYRKVIDIGALPNNTYKNIAHNISNLGIVTNLYGMASTSSGTRLTLNDITIRTYMNSTHIVCETTADRSSYSGYVIVEYTKTTD